MVPCAYSVPSGPVIWPDAVTTRRPELITCPVATTLGVFTVSALTRFTFSSRVVYAWPRSRAECAAQPMAESSRAQNTPPWTDPIGLYRCSPTSSENVTRPGWTSTMPIPSKAAIGGGGMRAPGDGPQVVQAAQVERQRGADHGVLPGDLAAPR